MVARVEAAPDAFEENFARRAALGGACCAFYVPTG